MDWTLEALNDLPERSIESYMLRTPWRAVSAYSTEQVKDILNAKYGTKFSSEAWRKRSKTVNVRVYLATGMWWDNFTTGLEDFFHVRQPRRPKNGNEKVITTGDEEDGDDDGGFTSRGIKDKNIFTILGNDEEGINFRCYATLEAASAASPLFDAAIAKDIFVYPRRFDTTRRALDMFLSCFMPIQQGNLPTSGCKLVRGTKDDSLRMLSLDWTLSDLFNVFALSDELENHKISNMVFNAWRKVLWNEEFLRWQYQEGKRKLSDPAINSSPSILDFKPAELNRLFSDDSASEVRAAAQDFWLGLLVIARDRGIQKIQDSQDEYSQEFLVKWHQYLSEAQQEAQKQDEQGNINMVDSGSSFAKHLDVLLNGNDADFCREYHIHAQNEVCDTPVSTAATIVKDSPRTEQPPSPRQAKLTIHSIPGFTIQNRTPLDEPTFKNVFAEAGWDEPERIRSVNDYVLNRRDFKDFRDYRPVEQPVYFSTGLQDPQGRWPSHPGYMNPDWKLDTVEDAQSQDPQSKEQAPEVQVIDFGTAPRVSNNLEGNTTNSQKLTEFKMNLTPEQLQDLSNSLPISDRVMALQEREAWWRAIMSSTYLR